jgi:hypothetical protein
MVDVGSDRPALKLLPAERYVIAQNISLSPCSCNRIEDRSSFNWPIPALLLSSMEERMPPQQPDIRADVLNLLQNFRGVEPIKELFWSRLNYDRVNKATSRRAWPGSALSRPVRFPSPHLRARARWL